MIKMICTGDRQPCNLGVRQQRYRLAEILLVIISATVVIPPPHAMAKLNFFFFPFSLLTFLSFCCSISPPLLLRNVLPSAAQMNACHACGNVPRPVQQTRTKQAVCNVPRASSGAGVGTTGKVAIFGGNIKSWDEGPPCGSSFFFFYFFFSPFVIMCSSSGHVPAAQASRRAIEVVGLC